MKATISIALAIWMVLLMAAVYRAQAQDARRLLDGTWQMQNVGRNHGVLSAPGMPKCNPQRPRLTRVNPLVDIAGR
jgi:hypothetical protein